MVAELRLGTQGDLGEKRARDVTDDEADRQARSPPEALREEVRLVSELVDHGQHAPAHARADVRMVGQDTRDG